MDGSGPESPIRLQSRCQQRLQLSNSMAGAGESAFKIAHLEGIGRTLQLTAGRRPQHHRTAWESSQHHRCFLKSKFSKIEGKKEAAVLFMT